MKYDLIELLGRDRRGTRGTATTNGLASRLTTAFGWVLAFLAFPAGAHPGHGLTEAGAMHLVTSPYHLATLLVAAAMLVLGARWTRSLGARRLMQAGAALSLIAAVAVWLN